MTTTLRKDAQSKRRLSRKAPDWYNIFKCCKYVITKQKRTSLLSLSGPKNINISSPGDRLK